MGSQAETQLVTTAGQGRGFVGGVVDPKCSYRTVASRFLGQTTQLCVFLTPESSDSRTSYELYPRKCKMHTHSQPGHN